MIFSQFLKDFLSDVALEYCTSYYHCASMSHYNQKSQKTHRKNNFHQKSSLQSIKDIFCRQNAPHHIANTQRIPELNGLQSWRINFRLET